MTDEEIGQKIVNRIIEGALCRVDSRDYGAPLVVWSANACEEIGQIVIKEYEQMVIKQYKDSISKREDEICEEIENRDCWEEWCAELARRLGCRRDSSNIHDHRDCIYDALQYAGVELIK